MKQRAFLLTVGVANPPPPFSLKDSPGCATLLQWVRAFKALSWAVQPGRNCVMRPHHPDPQDGPRRTRDVGSMALTQTRHRARVSLLGSCVVPGAVDPALSTFEGSSGEWYFVAPQPLPAAPSCTQLQLLRTTCVAWGSRFNAARTLLRFAVRCRCVVWLWSGYMLWPSNPWAVCVTIAT